MEHGYRESQRTFFVWEGVTQYLTEAAIQQTFQFLAKVAPGSHLVFTYVLQSFINGENTYGLKSLYDRFRVKDQVWLFGMNPQTVSTLLDHYGWRLVEDVGPEGYTTRYFEPIGRADSIAAIERVVHAEKELVN